MRGLLLPGGPLAAVSGRYSCIAVMNVVVCLYVVFCPRKKDSQRVKVDAKTLPIFYLLTLVFPLISSSK